MADFINREELKLQIAKQSRYFGFGFITKIIDIIKEQPSADTERHAHWIKNTVSSGQNSWTCSKCGRRARGKKENLPYCHCGCKMDEVSK